LSTVDIGTLDFENKVNIQSQLEEFGLLELNACQLLKAYQSASPGRRSFQCRLIELVAVAVHKLAARLFMRRERIHDQQTEDLAYMVDQVTAWEPSWSLPSHPKPLPTLFAHLSYDALGQYPQGLADVVGYWAENRIFGGVVLFDRSEVWDDDVNPEPNVYIHSDRKGAMVGVWQTRTAQQQALIDFLVSASAPADLYPLPLTASDFNTTRLDPAFATGNKVYRDVWERAPPKKNGVGESGVWRRDHVECSESFS
jgi:hypothetical protein